MDIYKQAAMLKLRAQYNGLKSVEELMDLDLPALEQIFQRAQSQLSQYSNESLLDTPAPLQEELILLVAILKDIAATKKAQVQAANDSLLEKARVQRYLEAIARKEDAEIDSLSLEELRSRIN